MTPALSPFIYAVAEPYKHLTSIPAAFIAVRQDPKDEGELVGNLFDQRIEEEKILQRLPKDLAALFQPGKRHLRVFDKASNLLFTSIAM